MVKRKKRKTAGKRTAKVRIKKDLNYKNIAVKVLLPAAVVVVVYFVYSLITDIVKTKKDTALTETVVTQESNTEENKIIEKAYKIQVLNGCGVSGVADIFTNLLRKAKYDVVGNDNYHLVGEGDKPYWKMQKTLVIDRSGNLEAANKLAAVLGTSNVIQQISEDLMVDADVVIGHDYKELSIYK